MQATTSTQRILLTLLLLTSAMIQAEVNTHSSNLPNILDNTNWELVLNKDGIHIYTQDWPNSNFVAIKTSQIINSSLSNIISNYLKIEQFPDWVQDMKEAHVVSPTPNIMRNNSSRISYMKMGLPWPLQDRDVVFGQNVTQDKNSLQVRVYEWNERDKLPELSGITRIPQP